MRLAKSSEKETSVINCERRSGQTKDLRRRAENRLEEKEKTRRADAEDRITASETKRLLQELQVHQIELEMQNEELQRSRAKAEALLDQYTDLYDFAPVGYFTLDRDGAIRRVNLTGARLLGLERKRLTGRRFGFFVSEADRPAFKAFLQKTFTGKNWEFCELTLPRERISPLFVRIEAEVSKDVRECRAVVLDVTEHHQAAVERDRLIEELQQALAKVNLLSGLLPICARCKNIRDDQGYWSQVETYISAHSEATFTHGLCPECTAKLYPRFGKTKEATP